MDQRPPRPTDLELDLLEKLACMHEQHAGVLRAVAAGFTPTEIAGLLGLTHRQVERRLATARKRLKRLLGKECFPSMSVPRGFGHLLDRGPRGEPRVS